MQIAALKFGAAASAPERPVEQTQHPVEAVPVAPAQPEPPVPIAVANVLVHWNGPRRLQAVLAALFALGLVATEVLFSSIASYRYLHSLPFFMFVNALPLAVALRARRARPMTYAPP